MVDVDYEPMDVEVDIEKAVLPDAPLVHSTHPGNIAADLTQISGDQSNFCQSRACNKNSCRCREKYCCAYGDQISSGSL